jgi:hypothetical protein
MYKPAIANIVKEPTITIDAIIIIRICGDIDCVSVVIVKSPAKWQITEFKHKCSEKI